MSLPPVDAPILPAAAHRPHASPIPHRSPSALRTLLLAALVIATPAMAEELPGWSCVFEDPCTSHWEQNWFRDGSRSTITHTPEGMILKTGPLEFKDASHEVLWTRRSFEGDVRVEYDFTRLDSNLDHVSVCILYLHATGKGGAFPEDISEWADQRATPTMGLYFRGMKLYHFSYACTGGDDKNYIRARRYPTRGNFQKDTLLEPSYENVDLFKPGETWHLVFEKVGPRLTFTATRGTERHEWKWETAAPELTGGRIGLRQMRDRESRFANFKVYRKTAP